MSEQSWSPVEPKRPPDHEGEPPNTLGDVLYPDGSAGSIPEDDWAGLVRAIAAGDQPALRALYERTHRLVFTLAIRIGGTRESAEEITLDVFHDVWRRSADYDPENGSVIGWIMNLTRSRAIDRVRFEQRKKRRPAHPDTGEEGDVERSGPADAMDARQRRGVLHEALTTLTRDERQAIETAFFGELTYSETAARLDQPLGTVKTRVRSALAKLRKALETEGGGE
jgi:RNA polymerase sigma-70 factor, ECF subfamily